MTYRVLLVEDEERIRSGLKQLIETIIGGFRVVGEAASGKEALDWLRRAEADLIVTDIRMPGMSGLEMVARIREDAPDLPVVILSGYEDFEYAKQAIRYQVTDYLLKPVSRTEFAGVLNRIAERLHVSHADEREDEETGLQQGGDRRLIIRKIKELIRERLDESLTLQDVAETVYLNPQYLSYLFKAETGRNFCDYLTEERINKAKRLLKETNLKIREVAVLCGYPHDKYFMTVFKQATGYTPSAFRDK